MEILYDGNYENYKKTQISRHKRLPRANDKALINESWVRNEELAAAANYVKANVPNLEFGICHGVCNGKENRAFKDILGVDVIGTEIAPNDFEGVIEWDFHEVKPEWINNVDFIYSNSFDHSVEPERALDAWMSCVKKEGGVCIIAWTIGNLKASATDPFGATFEEYKDLITKRYKIKHIIDASEWVSEDDDENAKSRKNIVIVHNTDGKV
jgi:hypothetical protein